MLSHPSQCIRGVLNKLASAKVFAKFEIVASMECKKANEEINIGNYQSMCGHLISRALVALNYIEEINAKLKKKQILFFG